MGAYSQAGRPLTVSTPLGPDALLLLSLVGHEAISRPFSFELALAAPDPLIVTFDRLLGQPVTARLALPDGRYRYFSGICSGLCQGMQAYDLTSFTMEIVPAAWRLTRVIQSRIFQRLSVPAILKRVLADVPDVTFDIEAEYPEVDFCVQYRESDFDFASRLMEEEGIHYYFVHEADRHRMIVSDRAEFPRLDPDRLMIQQSRDAVDEQRITSWEKRQRLRAGRVTLRDHSFELPNDPLEASAAAPQTVQVGRVPHPLASAGGAESLEIYEWPGAYARRFDGVDRYGNRLGEDSLQRILPDGRRTATIRMEQEAAEAILLRGQGLYRHMVPGHGFRLVELGPDAQRVRSIHDGEYVITSVGHRCDVGLDYRSGTSHGRFYQNSFTCIPTDIRYRPPRVTPRPLITGPQTAVVVKGPGEDEIFTDPYGRVKVKFFWDRDGGPSPDSSCWIRVSQPSAGGGFGMVFVPRGGQEVVVHFEDGDPDRPLITGAVYNPNQMPPFALPAGKMKSGFRSNTYPGGGGLNEISVDDSGKIERMYVHAQYNKDEVVGYNRTAQVGNDASESVAQNLTETVGQDKSVTITRNSTSSVGVNHDVAIGSNQTVSVGANRTESVGGNQSSTIRLNRTEEVGISSNEMVGMAKTVTVGGAYALTVGGAMNTAVGLAQVEEVGLSKTVIVGKQFSLTCGSSSLVLDSDGTVTIKGTKFVFNSTGSAQLSGAPVQIQGGPHVQVKAGIIDLN